jgi:hypothetical protein
MGTTNLPSGTRLSFEIDSEAYLDFAKAHPGEPDYEYAAQGHGIVRDGRFTSPRFGDVRGPLSPGRYQASVLLPSAESEPPRVQAILGKQGRNLRGPLVSHYPYAGKIAERRIWFTVP